VALVTRTTAPVELGCKSVATGTRSSPDLETVCLSGVGLINVESDSGDPRFWPMRAAACARFYELFSTSGKTRGS